MGNDEESGSFASNSPYSGEDRGGLRKWKGILFSAASLYPSA